MKRRAQGLFAAVVALCCVGFALAGCGQAQAPATSESSAASAASDSSAAPTTSESSAASAASESSATSATSEASAAQATSATPADGTYDIEVDTDSSMFRCEKCTLTVKDGTCTATLSLPGEGFSRLYFGTAEEAAADGAAPIYDYYLNDDGLYTFDLPVEKLDEELPIAAFGHRRDTWYDHTICFHAPTA